MRLQNIVFTLGLLVTDGRTDGRTGREHYASSHSMRMLE